MVAEVVGDIQYALGVEDPADASGRADLSDAVDGDARHSERIRVLDRRVFELELRFVRDGQKVIEVRVERAELTGRSGDTRGAAALYNRLGRDGRMPWTAALP
ncbi:hypothetical protein ACWEKM_38065 [Streptomyces sp. NPDC004752]